MTETLEVIQIGRAEYGAEILAGAESHTVRLSKSDGSVYDVVQGERRTTCDCGDFTHRHAGLDFSEGCKHVKALVAAGLVRNASPYDLVPARVVKPAPGQAGFFGDPVPSADPTPAAAEPAPKRAASLVEAYRPRVLSDLVGQHEAVGTLRTFLDDPVPAAFIFAGPTGVGKTSAALAFARELGADPDSIVGGVDEIPSGEQTADKIRALLPAMWLRPMSGNGWRVVILNEGDRMSEAVQYIWLDALEQLPPNTVVIFTTNHAEKMAKRLRDRCELCEFTADALAIGAEVQQRVNAVWFAETGRTDAPRVDDLPGVIEGGEISIRAALQKLTPLVRAAKKAPKPDPEPSPEAAPAETPAPEPEPAAPAPSPEPGKAGPDWDAVAARYKAGAKLSDLVRETGLPRQTVSNRLKKMGVKGKKGE